MNYFKLAYTTPDVLDRIEEAEKRGDYNEHLDPIDYTNCLPVDENFPYIPTGMLKFRQMLIRIFIINPFMWIVNRFIFHTKIYYNYSNDSHRCDMCTNKEKYNVQNTHNIICNIEEKIIKFSTIKRMSYKSQQAESGMIITCNHINKLDALVVRWTLKKSGILKGRQLKVMVADFNNQKGQLGKYMRAFGILPFPSGHRLVRLFDSAVSYYLERGDCVLVFPEQSEWWGYDRPRPLRNGAFFYAAKNNVPVQPLFITCRRNGKEQGVSGHGRSENKAEKTVAVSHFDVHILDRIEILQAETSLHEKTRIMREKNSLLWEKAYTTEKNM